jgi:hypothetical protein
MKGLHPIVEGRDRVTTTNAVVNANASCGLVMEQTLSTMDDTRFPGPPYGDSDCETIKDYYNAACDSKRT